MANGTIKHDAPENAESLIKLVYYTYNWTDSVASGESFSITASQFGASTPSGYSIMGVSRFTSGSSACVVSQINPRATGSTTMMSIRNKHTSAVSDKNAGIGIMYIRTAFCG